MIGIVSKLPGVDPKTMRLVSKTWNKAVVQSMDPSQVDLSVASKKKQKYLITTIKLPISNSDYRRIMDNGENFRLFGGGLQLILRTNEQDNDDDGEEEDDDLRAVNANLNLTRAASAMANLLESVRHLEIFSEHEETQELLDDYETNWDGGIYAVFGPILQRMKNVFRIRLDCASLAKVLHWLPSRKRIEELTVLSEYEANGAYWDAWENLLGTCHLQLKLLHGAKLIRYAEDLNMVVFPRLEELELNYTGLLPEDASECYIHQAAPNLKILKLICGSEDWVFLAELTHRLKFLQFLAIEMLGPGTSQMKHPSRPLRCAKFASRRLKEVILRSVEVASWEWEVLPYLFESSTKVVRFPFNSGEEKDESDNEGDYPQQLKEDLESLKVRCLPHENETLMQNTVAKLITLAEGRRSFKSADLLYDLLQVANFVNGPVMLSKELWSYFGEYNVSFKEFLQSAKMTQYVQSNPMSVPVAMVRDSGIRLLFYS